MSFLTPDWATLYGTIARTTLCYVDTVEMNNWPLPIHLFTYESCVTAYTRSYLGVTRETGNRRKLSQVDYYYIVYLRQFATILTISASAYQNTYIWYTRLRRLLTGYLCETGSNSNSRHCVFDALPAAQPTVSKH